MAVQMECVSQIDAGQDGKNIGLNERDPDFQSVHRNRERKGQPPDQQSAADGEAEEDPENHVAGRHIRKQPNGQRNGPRQLADQFDRHHQGQQPPGRPGRNENAQELDAMQKKPHDQAEPIHQTGEHGRHDNLARHGVAAGDQPNKVTEKNKEKQGGDEGEKPHPVFPHRVHDDAANEIHQDLRDVLQLARHQLAGRPRPSP